MTPFEFKRETSLMTHKHRITLALLTSTLLLGVNVAQATDYLVEVVIFETVAGKNLTAGGLFYPNIKNSLRIGSERAVAQGFLPVEQNLKLTEKAASVAASGRYRLLRHLSWRQPGLDADNAISIRVALGDPIPIYLANELSSDTEFYPAAANPTFSMPEEISTRTVFGTITVRLGRFLHMNTQLTFTDAESSQSFRLVQDRKMRSGELHYIDNPRFGLLTQITPLEDKAGIAAAN